MSSECLEGSRHFYCMFHLYLTTTPCGSCRPSKKCVLVVFNGVGVIECEETETVGDLPSLSHTSKWWIRTKTQVLNFYAPYPFVPQHLPLASEIQTWGVGWCTWVQVVRKQLHRGMGVAWERSARGGAV